MPAISFTPAIPMLEVFLVSEPKQLYKVERFKQMDLPKMDNAVAKTCHMANPETGEEIVVIVYPNLLSDEPADVFSTLVHEAVHAWDYIRSVYGYEHDMETNAYAIEHMFKGLFDIYSKHYHKQEKQNAKGT